MQQEIFTINYDDCKKAVGPMFVGQSALKCFANDKKKSISERCNAMILYDWIGHIDATINELITQSPSACDFILKCLREYQNDLPKNSNFVMNFGYAVESLEYQLTHNCPFIFEIKKQTSSFETQMNFVRERQQSKYENKLMAEEDTYSKIMNEKINEEEKIIKLKKMEEEKKIIEEEEKKLIQQKLIEEEIKKEQQEMDDFINDFVIKEFNRNKSNSINFDQVRERAIKLYYDRKLIRQQNEEYENCLKKYANNK